MMFGLEREDEPAGQICSSGTFPPGNDRKQEDSKLVKGRENFVDFIVANYRVIQGRQDTEKWDCCHNESEP